MKEKIDRKMIDRERQTDGQKDDFEVVFLISIRWNLRVILN